MNLNYKVYKMQIEKADISHVYKFHDVDITC